MVLTCQNTWSARATAISTTTRTTVSTITGNTVSIVTGSAASTITGTAVATVIGTAASTVTGTAVSSSQAVDKIIDAQLCCRSGDETKPQTQCQQRLRLPLDAHEGCLELSTPVVAYSAKLTA